MTRPAEPGASAGAAPEYSRFRVKPLVVPVVSGYVPEGSRGRRGIFSPLSPTAREERVAVPTREIVCYECGKRSRIPVAALSAHCVHCRSHLNASDMVLKPGSRRLTIRTLGDVSIPAHVELSHLSIFCKNLNVSGKASGSMQCTGELTLRGSAAVEGKVQAGSLLVVAGARATCSPSVSAESARVEGQLSGRLHVAQMIHIGRAGHLVGDCRTEALSLDPGGRHSGTWIRTSS